MRTFYMVVVALSLLGFAGTLTATPASAGAQVSDQIRVSKMVGDVASSPAIGAAPDDTVVVYWGFNASGEYF